MTSVAYDDGMRHGGCEVEVEDILFWVAYQWTGSIDNVDIQHMEVYLDRYDENSEIDLWEVLSKETQIKIDTAVFADIMRRIND